MINRIKTNINKAPIPAATPIIKVVSSGVPAAFGLSTNERDQRIIIIMFHHTTLRVTFAFYRQVYFEPF